MFRFVCCQDRINLDFKMAVPIKRLEWEGLCIVVNFTQTKLTILMKNLKEEINIEDNLKHSNESLKISKDGNFVIGQDQDNFQGGFNAAESFSGLITDMFLTGQFLDSDFIKNYLNCQVFYPKASLVNFKNINDTFDIFEDTKIIEVESNTTCNEDEMNLVFLPDGTTFSIAENFCQTLKGTLPVPSNEKQNELFYQSSDRCRKLGFLKAWIGIKSNITGDFEPYHHYTKEHLNFSSWRHPLKRSEVLSCGAAFFGLDLKEFNANGWYFSNCHISLCTACSFREKPALRTRGICEDSYFDRNFIVHGYFNNKIFFVGEYFSTIRWSIRSDKNGSQKGFWLLEVGGRNNSFAEMVMVSEFDYPMGVNTWKSVGSSCITNEDGRLELLLTTCDEDMFTCRDGSCVSMEKRCDLQVDCKDESDELRCFIAQKPKGYDSGKPPPRGDPNDPVMVEATLHIYSFHKIDLVNDHITLEVMYRRKWFDSNLILKNIKEDTTHNLFDLEETDLWYPNTKIIGEDNCTGEIKVLDKLSWVERNSNPLKDDEQNVLKGIYLYILQFFLTKGYNA